MAKAGRITVPVDVELSMRTVSSDQATLERNADVGGSTGPSSRRVVCYNRSCPDYRVERDWNVACGCRRTSIQGGGR